MRKRWLFWAPILTLSFIGFIIVGGVVVQQLWNWLLPTLFDVRPVTFWQALGVLALSRILFGGFGSHGGHRGYGPRRKHWRGMTPEERERFSVAASDGPGAAPTTL